MTRKQYRLIRRLTMVLAAAPLFQLGQCRTGTSQTLQFVGNQLPSTLYSLVQSIVLAPLFSALGGGSTAFGNGFGSNTTPGFGGGI